MSFPQSTASKLKLITESDASEMLLDSYVMHRSFQRCAHCDSMEQYSTIFEVWTHPTKTRTTGLTSLRLFSSMHGLKNLPLAFIDLPVRVIPTCSDCIEQYEIISGETPIPHSSREAWAATLKRKYTPEPSRSESPAKRQEPGLDML